MTTYVYQTIPSCDCEEPRYFEFRQSMKDTPFTQHPETGEPIKRVIVGGYGFIEKGKPSAPVAPSHGCCGGSCGCHH